MNDNIGTWYKESFVFSNYDSDALSFISAAGLTDSIQKSAINTLVKDMKSTNIWTKMKAIYPFVGGTALSHKWNLKDPRDLDIAFRLNFYGGITHSLTGALPNGITGYANTHLIPNSSLIENNIHISYYSESNVNTGGDQTDIGALDSYGYFWLSPQYNTGIYVNRFLSRNSSNIILANCENLDARGFYTSSKISNTVNSFKIYKNGILKDVKDGSGANPISNIFLFAGSVNNFALYYTNRECAFSTIGDGLTDIEASDFYNIVQKYQTTLGRNV